jgi:hypothetical protein
MSVQEYYAELQKGMVRCGVVEDAEDKVCRFYGGLKCEIQDIVDYKSFVSPFITSGSDLSLSSSVFC